ncbi:MAG: DUF6146 family protein [Cellulophaga sp.]
MKNIALKIGTFLVLTLLLVVSCTSTKKAVVISDEEKMAFNQTKGDTISIASDKTEYEILIIEAGFDMWLASIAKPNGYYSQSYLENRNRIYVSEWNSRVLQPFRFDSNMYEMQIDYDQNIDYGYELNYKLFNYFIFFQRKYNQRLAGFLPRI